MEDGEELVTVTVVPVLIGRDVIRQLLDVDYPQANKVKLLCDHLNTHNIASLYKAFPIRSR